MAQPAQRVNFKTTDTNVGVVNQYQDDVSGVLNAPESSNQESPNFGKITEYKPWWNKPKDATETNQIKQKVKSAVRTGRDIAAVAMDPTAITVKQKDELLNKLFPDNPGIKSKVNSLLKECRKANVLPNLRIPKPAICGGGNDGSGDGCSSDTVESLLNQISSTGGFSSASNLKKNRDLSSGVALTLAGIAAGICDAFKAAIDYLGSDNDVLPQIAAVVNTTLSKEHKVKAISGIVAQTIKDEVKAYEPDLLKDFMGDPDLGEEAYAVSSDRHIYNETGYRERDSALASDYMITTAEYIDEDWSKGGSSIEKLTNSEGKANKATASVFSDSLASAAPPSDPDAIPGDPNLDAKLAYISAA